MKKRKREKKIMFKAKRLVFLIIFIILIGLMSIIRDSNFSYRAISTIGILLLFSLLDHYFKIELNLKHYSYMIIIVVAGTLFSPIYFYYPQYDKFLHFLMPILYSSIVFFIVSPLNLKLRWKLTLTFFIVVGSLGIFEIGEYLLDIFFDMKLQGVFSLDRRRITETRINSISY